MGLIIKCENIYIGTIIKILKLQAGEVCDSTIVIPPKSKNMDPKNNISKITCIKYATPMAFRNSKTYTLQKSSPRM